MELSRDFAIVVRTSTHCVHKSYSTLKHDIKFLKHTVSRPKFLPYNFIISEEKEDDDNRLTCIKKNI